jgi:nucleotidyltransferase/DNA polymerase involved in DNA repair
MTIGQEERARMLRAHSIGPKMISFLDRIGIEKLEDLAGADARELAMRINVELGHRHLNALGVRALENLIELANRECRP